MKKTILLFFVIFIVVLPTKSHARKFLTKNQKETINKTASLSLMYTFRLPATLHVSVSEMFGKNIRFEILQDGKKIYSSGTKKGQASGSVEIEPGAVSLIVINGHWLQAKHVLITAYYTLRTTSLDQSQSLHYLINNQKIEMPPGSSYSKAYEIMRKTNLFIQISEMFGKNIEFKVIQQGNTLYDSGIKRGRAKKMLLVNKGKTFIIVKNGNLFRKKIILLTVAIPKKPSKW